jgi:hypothetical protein
VKHASTRPAGIALARAAFKPPPSGDANANDRPPQKCHPARHCCSEESTPEFFLDLFREIAVVDVLMERQAERFPDVLRKNTRLSLMAREQPERLDVEDEVLSVRSAHCCAVTGSGMA